MLEWLRLPGDVVFIVGGVLPFIWIAWHGAAALPSGQTTDEMPEHPLYTEARRRNRARSELTMNPPATSVWLMAGYALALVAVAWGFDRDGASHVAARCAMAHRTIRLPRRSRRVAVPGGSVAVADVVRSQSRVMRYRAKPACATAARSRRRARRRITAER